jgi:hypothetical protein
MKNILLPLQKILGTFRQYIVILCIVIFGVMYGFLIYTSGKLASQTPSESKINEKFQGASRPKLDEAVADQLLELEDQNIEVKALFDEARENPFAE